MPNFFYPPGSGGGGAGSTSAPWKNYIISGNNNAENNNTAGWTIQNVGVTSTFYPRYTGASWAAANAGLSLGVLTGTSALAGAFSYYLYSNVASTLGDALMTAPITIDNEDRTQPLAFKFYYSPMVGGASLAFYGTSGNSWAIWIYDTANTAWIQPAGTFNMVQSSGCGIATGTFQAPSNMTSFQLALLNITASGGSYLVGFDDFFVGPQTQPTGPAVTDWVSWTPTGSWSTNTTYTAHKRQIGDSYEYEVNIALTGAPTSAALTITLLETIDTTKIDGFSAGFSKVGVANIIAAGSQFAGDVRYNSTTSVAVRYYTATNPANVTQAAPGTFANGDAISLIFRVPIVGKSSNSSMSSDTDTRVVAAQMTGATASITGSYTDVTWTTIVNDTHGAMGAILYTVPVTGWYGFSGSLYVGATSLSAAGGFLVSLYNNTSSTTLREKQYLFDLNVPENESIDFNFQKIYLSAGTALKIQIKTSGTVGTPVVNSSATLNYFSVGRSSGPAVVAATESVNARYHSATATVTASLSVVTYSTKDFDSHAAYSGSTYTVPVSGKYQVNASIEIGATYTGLQYNFMAIYKNGSTFSENITTNYATTQGTTTVFDTVQCNAGDTIQIYVGSSGTTPVVTASTTQNYFSIARVGN